MRRFLSFLLVFLFGFIPMLMGGSLPEEGWVDLDDNPLSGRAPQIQIIETRADTLILEVKIPGFEISRENENGVEYIRISLPDSAFLQSIGKAELPQLGRLLQMPFNSEFNVRIVDRQTVSFEEANVYPLQEKPARSNPGQKIPFYADELFYCGDATYPGEIVTLGDSGVFRDICVSRLGIFPFQYNPSARRLDVHMKITIAVDIYKNRDSFLFKNESISSTFHNLYSQLVINYGHNSRTPRIEAESMLVFVSDPLDSSIQPLIEWKNQKGIKVYKILMSEISNSTAGIKAEIQNAYDTFTPKPSYVLLVGHADTVVPNYRSTAYGNAASDYPYTLLDGDNYPDILIGRILAKTNAHADVQVSKIINYEQNPFFGSEGEFYSKAAGIASNEGSNPSDEDYINMAADHLLGGTYTYHDYFFAAQGNATPANIISALNEGRTYLNYIGHGSGTGWSSTNGSFGNSNVYSINNPYRLPILIDVACMNGQYDHGYECFGEAWMYSGTPEAPKGAVGYYGGSVSVSWDPPAVMMVGIAKHHYEDPVYTFGGSCLAGQMYLVAQMGWSSSTEDNFEWYNIFGDPSLIIRTANPAVLDVDHPLLIPSGSTSATVNVSTAKGPFEGALVCIRAENNPGIYGSAFSDATGTATLNFENTVLPTDELYIKATGYNTSVYEANIMAGSTSDGIVSLDRDLYSCSHTAYISLIDADLEGQGTHSVSVTSTSSPTGIDITLSETEIDGFFQGSIQLGTQIQVSHSDILTVTYNDADTGGGSPGIKTAQAMIDCIGPEIFNVQIINTSGSSINLSFETSKTAKTYVNYGLDAGNMNMTVDISTSFKTVHNGTIPGLSPDTTYYFEISATDIVDNVSFSDIFSFTTPNILTIGDGNTELDYAPLYCYYHANRTQVIYLASDMGNTPLIVSSIAIDVTALPSLALNNWTIRMKHTDKDSYSTASVFETDGWTVVYQNNETITELGWLTFELIEPFFYDGSQNLMIDFSFNNSSWSSPWGKTKWTGVDSARAIRYHADSAGDPLNWTNSGNKENNIINIKLALTDSEAPMPPSNFQAEGVGENQIDLAWQKNTEGHDVLIVWSYENVFGSPMDGTDYTEGSAIAGGGTVLYKGGDTSVSHTGLPSSTTVYYRAFSYNSSLEYSPGTSTHASTLCGIIDTLPFAENFDGSSDLPICWEILDHQGNGQVWQIGTISNGLSGTTGNYAYLNSDGYGYGGSQNSDLVTPVLDLSGYYNITVSFTHYFRQYSSASTATFAYSTDNGSSWTAVQNWTATSNNPVYFSQLINEVGGQSQVRFKWNFTGSYAYYWCVDDILIESGSTEPQYAVSLYADPDDIGVSLSGAGNYTEGADVLISASRLRNWAFTEWTGLPSDIALLDDPYSSSASFAMPARAVAFTAVYTFPLPESPGNLIASTVSASQINISWTDNSENEQGFLIERKTGSGGTWSQIAQTSQNIAQYQDTGLSANTTYFYRVRAYNQGGNSDYSNEANATTHELDETVPVYRFFNTIRGGHIYTISESERDYIMENLPHYNYEGIKFHVYDIQTDQTTPVYRFFNTNNGIHLYTISESERDYILDNLPHYSYEGVKFHVFADTAEGVTPVYRFFNTVRGGHLYTISEVEREALMDLPQWSYEGIKFYVYPLD